MQILLICIYFLFINECFCFVVDIIRNNDRKKCNLLTFLIMVNFIYEKHCVHYFLFKGQIYNYVKQSYHRNSSVPPPLHKKKEFLKHISFPPPLPFDNLIGIKAISRRLKLNICYSS